MNHIIKDASEINKINFESNDNKIPKVIYRTSKYDLMHLPYNIGELYRK
jgi:hypothetical protein